MKIKYYIPYIAGFILFAVSCEKKVELTYKFDNNSKTAKVTYKGSSFTESEDEYIGDIAIPSKVKHNEIEYQITSIGESAFRGCKKITSITLPIGIQTIESWAFGECGELKKITIPDGTKSIGHRAFAGCYNLKDIILPNSVTKIGIGAFSGSGIINITLPDSITTIPESAFDCCEVEKVIIPEKIDTIGSCAFHWCNSLSQITIMANKPPHIYENSFSDYHATLYVPSKSIKKYKTHRVFGRFSNIQPITK